MTYNLTGNISNIPELGFQVSRELPIVAPVLTVFIWIIIAMTGMNASQTTNQEKKGFAMWLSIGGLFTNLALLILFMVSPQLITMFHLITSITIFLLISLWWLFSETNR